MRVVACSRVAPNAAAAAGAELRPLDGLLATSDIVSIHASLTPASRGLLDARRIGLMPPSAYLVNTARGPIVDEAGAYCRAGRQTDCRQGSMCSTARCQPDR